MGYRLFRPPSANTTTNNEIRPDGSKEIAKESPAKDSGPQDGALASVPDSDSDIGTGTGIVVGIDGGADAIPWSYEHEQAYSRQWERLLAQSENIYSQYQSLEWWRHIVSGSMPDNTSGHMFAQMAGQTSGQTSDNTPAQAFARASGQTLGHTSGQTFGNVQKHRLITETDDSGTLRSVAILTRTPFRHIIASRPVPVSIHYPRCVELLGSDVLGANSPETLERFFDYQFAAMPDIQACYCKSVKEGTPAHDFFSAIRWPKPEKDTTGSTSAGKNTYKGSVSKGYSALFLEEDRNFYTIELPDTFEEYLQKFKRKKRYNLKRQLRTLGEEGDGDISLLCITDKADIPAFAKDVFSIYARSWKADELAATLGDSATFTQSLFDLAEQDMLRAYLLKKGNDPVAYILGYDYREVFHYSDIAFDDAYSQHSPGNGLLYMVVQDLIENTDLRLVNFGIGDSEYKRNFANRTDKDSTILVWRHTFTNRLRAMAILRLHQLKQYIKSRR